MPIWEQFAADQASNAANGILGIGLGALNDKRQLKQQKKLQDLQIEGNKYMTDYNYQKQLEMWKATSYGAQKEQMLAAGISPALMYGMGGGGGQSTGSGGGNVQGASAPTGGREVQDMMGMGIQRALLEAQRQNIEADTKNKLIDAQNKDKGGVDYTNTQANTANTQQKTTNAQQELENLKQQQDNLRWDYEIKRVDVALKRLEEYRQGAVQGDLIKMVNTELKEAIEGLNAAKRNNRIGDATEQTMIGKVRAEAAGVVLDNKLKEWGIKIEPYKRNLLEQQFKVLGTNSMLDWDKLGNEKVRTEISRQLKDLGIQNAEDKTDEILNAIGNALKIVK